MRKAFKVATAFTGAAACAAAFTPAATAATATTPKPQIVPNTFHKNCTLNAFTTSMVFYWFVASNHGPTCVGSAGVPGSTPLNHVFQSMCTGNNHGWLSTGNGMKHYFRASNYYSPTEFTNFLGGGYYVAKVDIQGHGGNAVCFTS